MARKETFEKHVSEINANTPFVKSEIGKWQVPSGERYYIDDTLKVFLDLIFDVKPLDTVVAETQEDHDMCREADKKWFAEVLKKHIPQEKIRKTKKFKELSNVLQNRLGDLLDQKRNETIMQIAPLLPSGSPIDNMTIIDIVWRNATGGQSCLVFRRTLHEYDIGGIFRRYRTPFTSFELNMFQAETPEYAEKEYGTYRGNPNQTIDAGDCLSVRLISPFKIIPEKCSITLEVMEMRSHVGPKDIKIEQGLWPGHTRVKVGEPESEEGEVIIEKPSKSFDDPNDDVRGTADSIDDFLRDNSPQAYFICACGVKVPVEMKNGSTHPHEVVEGKYKCPECGKARQINNDMVGYMTGVCRDEKQNKYPENPIYMYVCQTCPKGPCIAPSCNKPVKCMKGNRHTLWKLMVPTQ